MTKKNQLLLCTAHNNKLQQHMHAVAIIDDVVPFMFVELSILVFCWIETHLWNIENDSTNQ